MDPNNPVVKLCAEGMAAEAEGRFDDARARFLDAWNGASNDYERCVAAHYVARHQSSREETLRWNRESLDRADAVGDNRVAEFYPSLLLNMGHAHEQLGEWAEAQSYYERAVETLDLLPDTPYGTMTRDAVARGLERVGEQAAGSGV